MNKTLYQQVTDQYRTRFSLHGEINYERLIVALIRPRSEHVAVLWPSRKRRIKGENTESSNQSASKFKGNIAHGDWKC